LSSQVLTTQEVSELTQTAWVRFLRAHAALTRELGARLEAEHGLTMSDFDVLIQLYHAPEHSMRRIDIARQVLLTASGITRLLDGLERCGLVAKQSCESDARVSYAVLTEEGLRKITAARESHSADVEELFGSALSASEREHLAELLGRLPLAPTSKECSE
jgi:DNA-binding MarR family transcriptional regulator